MSKLLGFDVVCVRLTNRRLEWFAPTLLRPNSLPKHFSSDRPIYFQTVLFPPIKTVHIYVPSTHAQCVIDEWCFDPFMATQGTMQKFSVFNQHPLSDFELNPLYLRTRNQKTKMTPKTTCSLNCHDDWFKWRNGPQVPFYTILSDRSVKRKRL